MPEFDIGFVGQITDLQKKLASIPGYTDKMAAQAATKMAMRFSSGQEKVAKAAKSTAEDVGKTTAASIKTVGDALKIVSPQAGALAERLSGGARGWGAMGGAAGLAAGAVLAASVALGAAVVGAVKLTQAADEAATRLQKLEEISGIEIISDDQVEKVHSAKAALDAVSSVGDVLKVQFASTLAPTIERVTVDMVAMGLALADSMNTGQDAVKGLAIWMGDKLVKAILMPATYMSWMAKLAARVADAMGKTGIAGALTKATDAYDDWTRSISANAVGFYASEITKAEIANTDYIARARELVGAQRELNESQRQGGKAAGEHAQALKVDLSVIEALRQAEADVATIRTRANEDLLTELDRILIARDEELARLTALAAQGVEATEVEQARADVVSRSERDLAQLRQQLAADYEKQREVEHQAELARVQAQAQAAITAANTFFWGVTDMARMAAEEQAEGNATAAARWFSWYQAASIAQVLVNQALAISKAFADLGPIAGALATVGLVGTMIAQVAAIKNQELPSYHSGGRIGERTVQALDDEHIVSRRGVRTAGGHDALDMLDRGQSPWPSTVEVGLRMGHRTFERIRVEIDRRGGAPGRGRRPVLGHRNGM